MGQGFSAPTGQTFEAKRLITQCGDAAHRRTFGSTPSSTHEMPAAPSRPSPSNVPGAIATGVLGTREPLGEAPPTQTELGQGSKSSYEHVWKLRLCGLRVSCSLPHTDPHGRSTPTENRGFQRRGAHRPLCRDPGAFVGGVVVVQVKRQKQQEVLRLLPKENFLHSFLVF